MRSRTHSKLKENRQPKLPPFGNRTGKPPPAFKFWLEICRTLLITGIAVSAYWAITLPDWTIKDRSQIKIEGDGLLSKDGVRKLISLSYPQSILELSAEQLSQQLESTAPIAKAVVTRQLLPPSLTIEIEERQPIALVLSPLSSAVISRPEELGFLDPNGIFLPKSFYTHVSANFELPTLKVRGYREQDRQSWSQIYQLLDRATVEIFEVDWQNPSNLVIFTELGQVYLGADHSQLEAQLRVLAQMGQLPERVDASKIDYIDLSNPQEPAIQMRS